jgi:hypothetical protein
MWGTSTLAEDLVLRGITIPAGSTFHDEDPFDDRVFALARDTIVHGVTVTAGSTLEVAPFPPPLTVVYTPLLLPLYPWIVWRRYRDVVVPGVVAIETAEALVVGDVEVYAGDRFWLGRRGLVALMIRSPRIIDGRELDVATISFGDDGRTRSILLYRPHRLGGLPCFGSGRVGTDVVFDEAGRVRRCVLSEDTVIGGKAYVGGTRIDLDENGDVTATRSMGIDVARYSPRPGVVR